MSCLHAAGLARNNNIVTSGGLAGGLLLLSMHCINTASRTLLLGITRIYLLTSNPCCHSLAALKIRLKDVAKVSRLALLAAQIDAVLSKTTVQNKTK
jgi:hypothetical protein